MRKLNAIKLIEFKNLPKHRKQTFVNNLRKPESSSEKGGNYWASCLSAIENACKMNDSNMIEEKIEYLRGKIKNEKRQQTKNMYQKNIDLLANFRGYQFSKLKPKRSIEFLSQPKTMSMLTIKGYQVQILPSHIFSYKVNSNQEVGAIWFVARLNGFKNEELAIFSELAFRYLSKHYNKEFLVNPNFCTAVDIVRMAEIRYTAKNNNMTPITDALLDEISSYLKP